jgi:predicted nucleic acid-binding Zn ribbon protein
LVTERGWETDVAVHGMFGRWESIVGPDVAQHCRPQRFDAGELVVQADSTAWATQMTLLSPTVVAKLNERLGDGTISKIVVTGPRAPSWKKGTRSVRGRGPRDTYG